MGNFVNVETKLKFLVEGIAYDERSEEDKPTYEDILKNQNMLAWKTV